MELNLVAIGPISSTDILLHTASIFSVQYADWTGKVMYDIDQMYDILQTAETNSVLKKCLTKDVIAKCRGRKTKYGGTIERCINSGMCKSLYAATKKEIKKEGP